MTIVANMLDIIDVTPVEEWWFTEPKRGDHIRVSRASGVYYHHGIYVDDNEVIHFTGQEDDSVMDWSSCEVIKTDIKQFLLGGSVEVKQYTDEEFRDLYPVEQIIIYARSCLGDAGYNLFFNNCEHFANVCTLGRFRSRQVEKLFGGVSIPSVGTNNPIKENKIMGLFSWIFGGGSSSSSRSTTTYEPDKVKIAEIERDTKIKLAGMESERIELMKEAKLDLLEAQTKSAMALEEAKARGFAAMAQTILVMQEQLNDIAEKRLLIIEKGSLSVVKEIEGFYSELEAKIHDDDDKYNTEKLPELLAMLERYEENSPAHKLYTKRIEDDMELQAKYYMKQLDAIANRQLQVINGFIASKEKVIEQTGQMTSGMIDSIRDKTLALNGKVVYFDEELPKNMQLEHKEGKALLEGKKKLENEKKALPEGKKKTK